MPAETRRRNTPQRRTILEHLRGTTTHPTAAEIYTDVRSHLPKISLGTVYRNLEVLLADGVIRRLDTGTGEAHFDARLDSHDHVQCTSCGRLRDVPGPSRGVVPDELAHSEVAGIVVKECRLEYHGTCRNCREREMQSADLPYNA